MTECPASRLHGGRKHEQGRAQPVSAGLCSIGGTSGVGGRGSRAPWLPSGTASQSPASGVTREIPREVPGSHPPDELCCPGGSDTVTSTCPRGTQVWGTAAPVILKPAWLSSHKPDVDLCLKNLGTWPLPPPATEGNTRTNERAPRKDIWSLHPIQRTWTFGGKMLTPWPRPPGGSARREPATGLPQACL